MCRFVPPFFPPYPLSFSPTRDLSGGWVSPATRTPLPRFVRVGFGILGFAIAPPLIAAAWSPSFHAATNCCPRGVIWILYVGPPRKAPCSFPGPALTRFAAMSDAHAGSESPPYKGIGPVLDSINRRSTDRRSVDSFSDRRSIFQVRSDAPGMVPRWWRRWQFGQRAIKFSAPFPPPSETMAK